MFNLQESEIKTEEMQKEQIINMRQYFLFLLDYSSINFLPYLIFSHITHVPSNKQFHPDPILFRKISMMVHDLHEIDPDNPLNIQITDNETKLEVMQEILKWCEMTQYTDQRVKTPIKSSNLEQNLGNKQSYLFIKNYNIDGERLKNLLDGANYWQIQSLIDVCICRIATELYFEQEHNSYQKLLDKLGIQEDITLADEERLKQQYPWIEDEQEMAINN